jgi:NAD(P)H-hydrate epimerase
MLSRVDTVLIGPGIGTSQETNEALIDLVSLIRTYDVSLVIDADALKALHADHHLIRDTTTIITPHAGEFKQFTGESLPITLSERIPIVEQWAKKLGINIFLKGSTDILTNGSFTRLNDVHHESMTVGGTGDVLAGIIACLLSKKTDAMSTMRIAAFLNGYAGNLTFQEQSYGLTATDIIDKIPIVLRDYL